MYSETDVILSNHPSLSGHFPGRPVAPAALLTQRIEAALGRLRPSLRMAGLTRARFRAPMTIGAPYEICFAELRMGRIKVELVQGGVLIMNGFILTG